MLVKMSVFKNRDRKNDDFIATFSIVAMIIIILAFLFIEEIVTPVILFVKRMINAETMFLIIGVAVILTAFLIILFLIKKRDNKIMKKIGVGRKF